MARSAPKIGNMPARSMIMAPVAIVKRFTTLVIATRPTFWLNDVIGRQPNKAETELTKPSQAREPDISFCVTSRFKPLAASAVVSPIVSVADTRNMRTTENIASKRNSGLNGIK